MLEFDQEDAREAGEIRAHLASKGMPMGPCDLLIAGQANARKLTFVTRNTTEFQRVPALKIEDWKKAASSPTPPRPQKSQTKPRSEQEASAPPRAASRADGRNAERISELGMLVSLAFASWNQLDGWLRQVEGLRRAA